MPKQSVGQQIGIRAETFVDKLVSDAVCIWNSRPRDFGIDGQIEAVDANGQVSGFATLAQVKGTEGRFPGENDQSFRFSCRADHVDYWLRCHQPVVLICVNVTRKQAWWKRIDTWFADPVRKARRVVEFYKHADRLDRQAVTRIAALGVPVGQPLPRLAASERLTSNLLVVESFAPEIYAASTPCRDRGDAWARMRANGAFESGFHLANGQIYSMAPLQDGPLAVLRDGPVEAHLTPEWSHTDDPDLYRLFVALLNFTVRAIHYRELVWHPKKQIVYYQASSDLSAKKVKGRSKRSRGRDFFKPYFGKDDTTKVSYYRHYAAGLYFCRWAGRWFLEINPTYHFTIDGRRDSLYDAEYVKKIKRLERNSAVFQLVRAWADFLRGEDTLFASRDERILFGELLAVDADAAIDEKAWIPPPEPSAVDAGEDGGLLVGLWDLPP